ncbi:MAG: amino acid ABC transporter permease [Pyrodictiaceae archaeon]
MITLSDVIFILQGLPATLLISFASFAMGFALGIPLTILRLYAPRPLAMLGDGYVKIFLGVPVLVVMLFFYFGLGKYILLFKDPYFSAIFALGLRSGAYQSQIFKTAINSIPRDQFMAAKALGLTKYQVIRYIVLPQAFIVALPGLGSELALLIKDSSYSFILGVLDITMHADILRRAHRLFFMPYLIGALLYIILTFPVANYLDRLGSKLKDKYGLR